MERLFRDGGQGSSVDAAPEALADPTETRASTPDR
jgi:hypothetical protein